MTVNDIGGGQGGKLMPRDIDRGAGGRLAELLAKFQRLLDQLDGGANWRFKRGGPDTGRPDFGNMPSVQPVYGVMLPPRPGPGNLPDVQPGVGATPPPHTNPGNLPDVQPGFGATPPPHTSPGNMPVIQPVYGVMLPPARR